MNSILYIDACVRPCSRTRRLADELIKRLDGRVTHLILEEEGLTPLGGAELERREGFVQNEDFSDPMFRFAKLFKEADEIVIAAPYWDMSFPSSLKVFIERVAVRGLTFTYTDEGLPIGLCRAKRLWYVTTMGGAGLPYDYGYGYIKSLCAAYYGINEAKLINAEGLDIFRNDPEVILSNTISELSKG